MEKLLHILIVDDEKVNINALREILKTDYMVQVAKNGHQALELSKTNPPDLILLDIIMPDMDGYEVCKALKSKKDTRHIPIIFITAKSDHEDELYGLQLGAVDYITKPLNAAIVKARVRTHLDLKLYRDHMENLVENRTRQLNEKSKDLEESNIALRVFLSKSDESQKQAKDKLLHIVKDSVIPMLDKMELEESISSQKIYIDLIKSYLNNAIDSFSVKPNLKLYKLTLTEEQIANLIREGKKTKEIAELLTLETRTIDWYRDSIRKKLGLKNKKTTLKSHLIAMQK